MLRIAVCDDEVVFQRKLSGLIRQILKQHEVDCGILCFSSGEELIKSCKKKADIDILFIDVNMKEIDGVEAAKVIRMYAPCVHIVFVTAFISYALDGYKVGAERYLLKGGDNFVGSLKECINAVLAKMNYSEQTVTLNFQSGKMELSVDRILYVESQHHKSIFHVLDNGVKEYYMYEKLDNVQKTLSDKGFMRVHQSFIVNMKNVDCLERYEATLTDGTKINISKKYSKAVGAEFVRQKGEI